MGQVPVRRVITGNDTNGRSVIASDEATPHVKTSPHRPGVVINNLWMLAGVPGVLPGAPDPAHADMPLAPAAGGVNFRIVEFPPEAGYIDSLDATDAHKAFDELGASAALDTSATRHPFMHRTSSIDFAIIVSGEIHLVLDEEETLMRAGEVCIQRGTNHVWSNRSDAPCRIAFVLIDAA